MTDDVSVLGENQELALFFDEDDSLEESIFFLANQQIEKNRKDVVNNIISACPALAEIVNGLHETEQLRLVFSDEVKMGLENGIYKMMKAKDAAGGFKAIVVDQAGKIKNIPDVAVDKALVGVNPAQMAMAMQGMAIQQQLQDISEQLGEISMALNDVLAGQHNDRLAKYFAGASLYKEALSVSDDELRKDLTNSALMMLSDAYSELSVSLKYQIDKICSKYDEKSGSLKKIKTDELCTEMVKINSSFQAIHKAIALKTAIYYKNGEYSACTTVLNEYGKFLTKTLPKEKADILYLADPNDKGFAGVWNDRKLPVKAGISALSEYSMLADNNYPTYVIEKKGIASSGIRDMKQVGRGEDTGCRVFELGYIIDKIKKDVQDPLSVMLSIRDEMDDERVEASVNEMLKEYVW